METIDYYLIQKILPKVSILNKRILKMTKLKEVTLEKNYLWIVILTAILSPAGMVTLIDYLKRISKNYFTFSKFLIFFSSLSKEDHARALSRPV